MVHSIYCPEVSKGKICGQIAEVEDGYSLFSTDGPVAMVRVRCLADHVLNMPSESLIENKNT